jgi:hypothetical protein
MAVMDFNQSVRSTGALDVGTDEALHHIQQLVHFVMKRDDVTKADLWPLLRLENALLNERVL